MKLTLLYNEEQSKAELIEQRILKPWADYCLNNWLNDNSGNTLSPEIRVKRLLDRCGSLLLRDIPLDKRNTLTSYKEMVIGSREIGFSDCPAQLAAMAECGNVRLDMLPKEEKQAYRQLTERLDERCGSCSEKKDNKRRTTRFDRLNEIQRMYPGATLHRCQVDTDGCFEYNGAVYQVDSTQGKYAPHKTRYGDQYDMDRIIVIDVPGSGIHFADQDGYLMDDGMIAVLTR